ncbi:MAG: hypothetical protein F6K22_07475 [Okeania sp. SIO2F4]|uniref:hypothetical protein n=1 Tax=Okeania sp. SIO2F4 TaxID=2607790 RepID=UPI00142BEFE4|nr:hypothetical protein [Okeania sp. SIO2F4]NES02699.1 hypothetical protein [Okeania sp. SIO2F4]
MKSQEPFSNSLDPANGIFLEIWEPDLIVLPILERTPLANILANISFKLWLKLTNQRAKPWKIYPDPIITPELMSSDGKVLERKLTTKNREIYAEDNIIYRRDNLVNKVVDFMSSLIDDLARRDISWLSPKTATSIPIAARVSWEKDLLQLHLPTNNSFFDALKPGNYQLRFMYESSNKTKLKTVKFPFQTINKKTIKGDRLTTSFVNIRLVELAKQNDKAIEVDGIRFETTLPETVLSLPEKKDGVETSVQIGIRITNNSNTDFYFNFYNTLIPQLITPNWQIVKKHYTSNFLKRILVSDLLLAVPGESITFFPNAKLLWKKNDKFKLKIAAGDGGYWIFDNLKAGRYLLQLTYKNKSVETTVYDRITKEGISFKKLWRGMVLVPFVELYLEI